MSLQPGTRIGPYEVTALIGEGGMGKVWRAHHTALKRDDALKVLPDAFAADPERLARFRREAQVLASLNHPNIAHVHGLEQSDGVQALVMELVEGPTLADRIAQGPIPVDEALPIAKQIAEALEAAHERGIIHRDLKPANIKVRPDGTVKVLDFGLAKALDPVSAGVDVTASPTITSPAMMTGVGMLLGTAAYMSPEQARGKAVDKRSDIWAFGCVLYEMLTGVRAFGGEDVTDTLASIITKEPNWSALPTTTSPSIQKLLRRCLAKDRKRRLADAADVRLEITETLETPLQKDGGIQPASGWHQVIRYVAAVAATAAVATPLGWIIARGGSAAIQPMRFTVDLPPSVQLYPGALVRLAISRDGRRVVYPGLDSGITRIYVRSFDQLEPLVIRGVERVGSVFLSPDGEWIGYNDATGAFKKVPVAGGPSATICEVPVQGGGYRGATWGTTGRIVFATAGSRGLMHVSDAGGTPEPLTSPPEGEIHRDPHFLPDGQHVLFVIQRPGESDRIAVTALNSSEPRVLLNGNYPKYASSGHLVFLRDSALWAMTFDVRRMEISGSAVPVLEGLDVGTSVAQYDFADNGSLVYAPSGSGLAIRTLTWVDRQGVEEPIPAPPRAYAVARASPDGTRIAVDIRDRGGDIWVWDVRGQTLTPMTFDRAADLAPVWTPDGRRIAFRSDRDGPGNLYWRAADGTGSEERLTKSGNVQSPTAFSPDGRHLLFHENAAGKTLLDVMALQMERSQNSTPLVQTQFPEVNGDISPDGKWLAYQSLESGTSQIFVRPFPDVQTGRWPVSANGGMHPTWSRDGRELFYMDLEARLLSATIDVAAGFRAATPKTILERRYFAALPTNVRAYDVSPDGRRFLMIKSPGGPEGARAQIVIVQNWFEELKRLVPTN